MRPTENLETVDRFYCKVPPNNHQTQLAWNYIGNHLGVSRGSALAVAVQHKNGVKISKSFVKSGVGYSLIRPEIRLLTGRRARCRTMYSTSAGTACDFSKSLENDSSNTAASCRRILIEGGDKSRSTRLTQTPDLLRQVTRLRNVRPRNLRRRRKYAPRIFILKHQPVLIDQFFEKHQSFLICSYAVKFSHHFHDCGALRIWPVRTYFAKLSAKPLHQLCKSRLSGDCRSQIPKKKLSRVTKYQQYQF